MVYLTKKNIKGKEYYYLVKSIRLPDSSIKKITKIVKKQSLKVLEGKHKQFFIEKEKEIYTKFALKKYTLDPILNKKEIEKMESMRVDYSIIMKTLSKNQLKDLFDRFTANFTYESNAIEGNSLTLKDVGIVIFDKGTVKNKSLKEIYETKNSREAVELMINKKIKLNEKDIIKLHKIIVKDTGVGVGYKKVPNFLLGGKVKTTPPEKVPEAMNKLIEWYEDSVDLHPFTKAVLFHGKFEKIHPFDDGNGRVGRIMANVILTRNGYAPIIIRKTAREAYLKALGAFDNGYDKKLKRFFLAKYKQTFRNFFQVYTKYL